jgi:superfamily II DNA or RNA helicase
VDKRDILHDSGLEYFEEHDFKTLFKLPTGTGKSVLTIKILNKYQGKYLLVTPTIVLHKVDWKNEFIKFDSEELYNQLDKCCYVSLHKYNMNDYDGIILDEAHHFSAKQWYEFIKYLPILENKKIICLTATPGKFGFTKRTLHTLIKGNVFEYGVEEAVDNELVNDFRIHVIYNTLDSVTKNSNGGNKNSPFLTTEKSNYEYLTTTIDDLKKSMETTEGKVKNLQFYQIMIRKRAKLLYDLESKVNLVLKFLKDFDSSKKRLIFARTIEVAERLEPHSVHSKSKIDWLTDFRLGKINSISSVDMLLEGVNLPGTEVGIITSPYAERKFIQSLGRCLRNPLNVISHYYIFCTKDTVEEDWLKSSLEDINKEKIIYEQ